MKKQVLRRIDPRTRKRYRMARWLEGDGVEIGALFRPLVVPRWVKVRYVDRMSVADLRHHYPELAGRALVPVDIIGSADDLLALEDESVDFVIANHLMEHMEYPIRALATMHRVLRAGGVLYLALPDERISLDRGRQLTPVEHLLEEHRQGGDGTRRQHFEDFVRYFEKRPEVAESRATELMEADYSIHFHVWRLDSFLEFVFAAAAEIGLDLDLLEAVGPEYPGDDEFIVVLRRGHRIEPTALPRDASWRQRVRRSKLGPVLLPAYRAVKRVAPQRAPR